MSAGFFFEVEVCSSRLEFREKRVNQQEQPWGVWILSVFELRGKKGLIFSNIFYWEESGLFQQKIEMVSILSSLFFSE